MRSPLPPALVDRLCGVIVESRPASEVIEIHDAPDALHYVDPPYVHSTRGFDAGGTHRTSYRHEMSDKDHAALAKLLRKVKGMVVLSGYACPLYDEKLYRDWRRFERPHWADGARPRVEVVWINAACAKALAGATHQLSLIT